MNPEDPTAGQTADLRQRLQGSQTQQAATRAEARRLARELALTRRLLRFALGAPLPNPPQAKPPISARRAVRLTEQVLFHLDPSGRRGAHTMVSGWAFRPVPEWDARTAAVTLLFRAGTEVYAVAASRTARPDIAVHFAARQDQAGGVRGLDGAGFCCEVINASLPTGVDLEIVLRLECAGLVCEQPTGRRLRF